MLNTTRQTATQVVEEAPLQGFFTLTFSNSRRHGLRAIQTRHCQGALFSTGHVHLDTQNLRIVHFWTLSQMCEYLEQFGFFKVSWEDE